MPKIFPVVVKRIEAAPTGDADITWLDTVHFDGDVIAVKPAFIEAVHFDGDLIGSIRPAFPDVVHFDGDIISALRSALVDVVHFDGDVPSFRPAFVEEVHFDGDLISSLRPEFVDVVHFDGDVMSATATATDPNTDDVHFDGDRPTAVNITDARWARSGTPDADFIGDGWVDQASTADNNGNENLLVKSVSAVPGSDAREGFIKWDLTATRLENLTRRVGGVHTITLQVSHNLAVGTMVLNWDVRHNNAASPFTESGLTWANKPAGAASIVAGTFTVNAGAAQPFTITLTDAQCVTALGKWVYIRFTSGTALGLNTITVTSRDGGTANDPRLSLGLERL